MILNSFKLFAYSFRSALTMRKSFLETSAIKKIMLMSSSVARGGGGAIAPLIGMSTKMQNGKNTTFLALLTLFYALEWTKK